MSPRFAIWKQGALAALAAGAMLGCAHGETKETAEPASAATIPAENLQPIVYDRQVLPLLTKYCYTCHGNGASSGRIALDKFKTEIEMKGDRHTWEEVKEHVGDNSMPPANQPQPTAAERKLVLDWVAQLLA